MTITHAPDVPVRAPSFVPAEFDPTDLAALRGRAKALDERPLASASDLEAWLTDFGELADRVHAAGTRRTVATTRDTADEEARQSMLAFERDVVPEWRRERDRLLRRYLECPARSGLGPRFAVLDRRFAVEADLFREENLPLLVEEVELKTEYTRIVGGRLVEFRGEKSTAQRVAARLDDPDRETRREAYLALAAARLGDRERLDDLFDRLLAIRQEIAANAGCADYREYRFREMHRFDYTPADCETFHGAVEEVVVPAVRERMERRRRALGLPRLAPYDAAVDDTGRPPLRPFEDETGLIGLGERLFGAVDSRFAEEFDILVRNGLLDLMSRPGKAPGGYNTKVEDIRLPFIFMNAVGRHEDLRTLLHEGGHAFHVLLTRDEPIPFLHHAPMEFCEVASMAMEYFGFEELEHIYAPEDARAAFRRHLDLRLHLFRWVATVDAFQHWLYTHPGHARDEREARWRELRDRFAPEFDWTGLEDLRAGEWQAQLHLFRYPFYYIEYGLAQLGAMQVWARSRRDRAAAVEDYRAALALGGAPPLPELFRAAGARFAMGVPIFREVTGAALARLAELDPRGG